MPLTFYPHMEDINKGTLDERVDVVAEAAERFKAAVLDTAAKGLTPEAEKKAMLPREHTISFNWEEMARVLRETRDLPEISKLDKQKKAMTLTKLAEIYEVLRAAKMPKLEAVRLALINEATQLRGSSSQVA